MLPEILCIVKQQNQAQYDFVKLEINSVLSYSLLVRDGSFCLSFVASLKQRSWTSKVYCMSSKWSRSRLMSPNNKITILLQAKHVLVIRAIAWMYLTSLIRNECWQNSWWEDNTLQWLFKRLFVPLRPRLIFFTFSFISCCVSLSIPPTFIPVISRVSSRHLSYLTTCDHFVFTLALLDASSKPFPLRYLCFLALFLPFRSAYIPKFFPLRSACFRSRLYYLEPPPPFPPPLHFCREFPCEKPCSQGLSAFESAEKPGLIARDTSDSKNKVIHLFSIINVIQEPLKLAQGMFGFYFVQWLVLLPR